MWIFLGVVAFLAILITVILMLPVYIIIKNDQNGELILRYKILWKVFGEDPDPDMPIIKMLREASGIARLEKKNLKSSAKQTGLSFAVSQTLKIVIDLLREIISLLKYCTIKKFHIKVVCSEEDAAKTAISYGQCCCALYPLVSLLNSMLKIRKKGQRVEVLCDYLSGKDSFKLDFLISVRFYRVLAAFFRIAYKEAKRTAQEQALQQTKQ